MQSKPIKILAIETSCDETAAAVIFSESNSMTPKVVSNIISSQVDLHAVTGGVVPEVASRAHMEAIVPVIMQALLQAKYQISSVSAGASPDGNIKYQKDGENYQKAIDYLRNDITHVAVTVGPGLIGSLLVGYNAAKTISYALNLPLIPVNHIAGHIYSAFINSNQKSSVSAGASPDGNIKYQEYSSHSVAGSINNMPDFPLLALTVSGGHTSLTLMKKHGSYKNIGSTLDDAAGEAFDKVAKLLNLGYPGGPAVSKLASQFRNSDQYSVISNQKKPTTDPPAGGLTTILFPRPIINDKTFNFSFSGLKTAVLQKVIDLKFKEFKSYHPERLKGVEGPHQLSDQIRNEIIRVKLPKEKTEEICAAFEDAAVDVLVTKTLRAVKQYKPKSVILAGGVSANKHLRETMQHQISNVEYDDGTKPQFFMPEIEYCGDNAAMIGIVAYYQLLEGNYTDWKNTKIDSNLELA